MQKTTKTKTRHLIPFLISIFAVTFCNISSIPLALAASPGDYQTRQSGNWAATTTWERWNGVSWITPAPSAPTAGDGVITILSGHTVTAASSAGGDQITIETGGELDIGSGITFTLDNGAGTDMTVSGTLTNIGGTLEQTGATIAFSAGGTYNHNLNGGTIPTAVWDTNSNCNIIGWTNSAAIAGINQSFGNFTWNSPSQTTNPLNLSGALNTINGNFTVADTGTGALALGDATGANLTIGGNFVQSGGSLLLETTGASGAMTVSSDFTLTLGTFDLSAGAAGNNGTLNVGGNFTHSGGTLTESGSSTGSVVIFNGAGVQTLSSGGSVTNRVNFTVNSGSTLQMATGTSKIASGLGSIFTLSSGATLGITSVAGITSSGATGNIQTTTRSYSTGASYIYNGAAGQATGNGLPVTVNNLTVNNPAGITTLTNNTAVNGVLTLLSGNVTTGANNLFISSTGSVARTSGHIIGNLKKFIETGTTAKTFEIGDSANYTPVDVLFNGVSQAGDLNVKTTAGDHPNIGGSVIVPSESVNRYWSLTNSNILFSDYSAIFHFINPGDTDAGINTANVIVGEYAGGVWSYPAAGARNATNTQITGADSFGDIQIGQTVNVAPDAPTIVSPANGGTVTDTTPLLTARYIDPNPSDTGKINFRIAADPSDCLAGTVISSGASSTTSTNNENASWSPSSPIGSDGTYYWCAQNDDDAELSAWTAMGSFFLDTSGPSFSSITPASDTFINSITASSAVNYTLNKDFAAGTIVIARTGGNADPASPHTCTLTGTALNAGVHAAFDMSDTVNSCTTSQSLVNGTVYTFTFSGSDSIGNNATPVINTNITFDTTAPAFSAVSPATSETINNITSTSDIGYSLDETLAGGAIVMTRTAGTADASSPHTCTLTGTALNAGAHAAFNMSDTANSCTVAQSLISGAIYTFAFDGTDAAGNAATQISNTGITFDSTAPTVTQVSPVPTPTTDTTPSYTFNTTEDGSIVYGGDCSSATTSTTSGNNTVTFNALSQGSHSNCTIRITDAVGNQSSVLNVSAFTIDTTAPVFSSVAPVTGGSIRNITSSSGVNYTLSENIASGSIIMTRTGGNTDASSPHTCTLKGTALSAGAHTAFDMSDTNNSCTSIQSLVSGTVYTFAFDGTDAAGNGATTITNTGITYDDTAPVFSGITPATDSSIVSITTSSAVAYTLSKNIVSGSIVMTRTGGTADASSPHTCSLTGTALNSGAHATFDMSDTANSCAVAQSLVSGAIYEFAFNGTDSAGNTATPIINTNITFDTDPPVFSSVAPATGTSINNATTSSDISYTLSETIANGTIVITRTGGTADVSSPHTCSLTGSALNSGAHSGFDISDTANSCASAQTLVGGAIYSFAFNGTDPAGNTAAQILNTGITFDDSAPGVTLTSSSSNPTNTSPMPVTATFSEDVTGFTAGDISIGNGTAGNLAGGPSVYTFDVTPTGQGVVTIDIAATIAQDGAGNDNTAATQITRTFDSAAPSVILTSGASNPTNFSPVPVTATFSENVTDFDVSDITVGNGSAGNFAGGPSIFTFEITPAGQGPVTIEIAAAAAKDSSGNDSTAAAQISRTYDNIAPTLTETAPVPTPSNNIVPNYAFDSSDAGPITYGGDCSSTTTSATSGNNSITFDTLGEGPHGNCTISVSDTAGNTNTLNVSGFTIDLTPPTVALSTTAPDPTNTSPVPVTTTFSENVTGFDSGDITFVNGSASNFIPVSGSVYTFDAIPTGQGTISIDIAGGTSQDSAGNLNTAATQLNRVFDNLSPSVSITSGAPEPTNSSPIPFTATFNENVTGFDLTDITIGNGGAGDFTSVDGATYTFTVTPAGQGIVSVDIAGGAAQDSAGNPNTAAGTVTRTFDSVNPTVILASVISNPTNAGSIPMSATFSQDVTGFELPDLIVANGTASNLTGSGTYYTFDVTPAGQGPITVDVPVGAANDSATNPSFGASQFSVTYDSIAPAVSSAAALDTNGDGMMDRITLTFDEALADTAAGANGFDITSALSHGICDSETSDPDGTTALIVNFLCAQPDTAVDDLTLNLSANPGIVDAAGNQSGPLLLTLSSSPAITDGANPIVVSTSPANNDAGVNYDGNISVNFSEPINIGTFTISDNDINAFNAPIWSNGNKTVTVTHDNWSFNTLITAVTTGSDLTGRSLNGGNHSWSFTTGASGNLGQLVVPATINIPDAGTDFSSGISTASGGNIMINAAPQLLNSITSGDISALDLTPPTTIGDQSVTARKAVTLNAGAPITLTNAGLTGATVTMPDETTIFSCNTWNGIFLLKAGSNAGTAPSGYTIGGNVIELGASSCDTLLDKPVDILLAGITGPIAYNPPGSANWFALATCGGTYAAPTSPAPPAPFSECSITDGTDTKILTYHLSSFAPLVAVPPPATPPPVTPPTVTQNTGTTGGYSPGTRLTDLIKTTAKQPVKTPLKVTRTTSTDKTVETACDNPSSAVPFSDTGATGNQDAIEYLRRNCFMDGISENSFGPGEPLTRAVMIKALIKLFNPGGQKYVSLFDDVKKDNPFAPYLLRAVKLGIIKPQSINYLSLLLLKPDDTLTRAEALQMALKTKGVDLENYTGKSGFLDVSQNDWFYRATAFAGNAQVMETENHDLNFNGHVKTYYKLPRSLETGVSGPDVTNLKMILMQLNYFTGKPDQDYTTGLIEAVKAFQKVNNLKQTGLINPATRTKILNSHLTPGKFSFFRPYEKINRGEAATLLFRIAKMR